LIFGWIGRGNWERRGEERRDNKTREGKERSKAKIKRKRLSSRQRRLDGGVTGGLFEIYRIEYT
jgi:hypothetical protein